MKKKPIMEKAVNFVRVYPADYEKLRALAFEQHIPLPKILQKLIADAKKSPKPSEIFE